MDKDLLYILYNYFNTTLKSSLQYTDTFLLPTSFSDNLITFKYERVTKEFSSILYQDKNIISDLKSKLKSLFDEYYQNLTSIDLIFSDKEFSIKLNFKSVLLPEIYPLIVP